MLLNDTGAPKIYKIKDLYGPEAEDEGEIDSTASAAFRERICRINALIRRFPDGIALFLVVSVLFHFFLIRAIHTLSWRDAPLEEKQASQSVVFKIREPEKDIPEKVKLPPEAPNPPERAASAPPPQEKPRKRKFQELPPAHLEALGKSHMDMVREGSFPALIFSYSSPRTFIQEMYRLGCKTLIYDRFADSYHEIQLFKGEISPLNKSEISGFSPLKRVIGDPQWQAEARKFAVRLNADPDAIQILLLVPESLEARWMGHQVNLFRQKKIDVSEILTVGSLFEHGKLMIKRAHMKDGSVVEIGDVSGI